jgi:hypothetical protein
MKERVEKREEEENTVKNNMKGPGEKKGKERT